MHFFLHKVEFLGRIVGQDKLAMAEKDIEAVKQWPVPRDFKDMQRFMGRVNYHKGFVKNFAELSEPLYGVVGKDKF